VFLAAVFTLTIFACQDQGAPVQAPVNPKPFQHGYYVPGQIVASFVDTITLAQAQSFVQSLDLTAVDFSFFEADPLHSGIIGVPIGMEQSWVDSLKTYPAFVKNATRLAVMEIS